MKVISRRFTRKALAPLCSSAVALQLALSFAPQANAALQTAKKADDFVETVGVCIHVQNFNDSQWNTVQAQLGALGVRYYREGLEHVDDATKKARLQGLFDSYGMKMLAVTGPYGNNNLQPQSNGSLQHVADKLAGIKQFLHAVEGPNEPEYFWFDGWNYGGFTDRPSQVVWYQNKLYDTVKADSRISNFPVTTMAMARGETPYNWYQSKPLIKHDIIAYHHYNGRNLPNTNDSVGNARAYYSSNKPTYLTEHGYRVMGDGNVTQKGQMKLNTRSMAAFYDDNNNLKTFFYVAGPDTAAGEDYGLSNLDYTVRPTYNAMKNVLNYLKDATWNTSTKTWNKPTFTPGALDWSVSGDTGQYGWRLLQKSNGVFYLIALPYINVANTGDGSDITNSLRNATLTFGSNQKVVQYKTDDNGNYTETTLTNSGTSVNVGLPDTLMIFKISSGGAPLPTPTPTPTPTAIPIGKRVSMKALNNGKFVMSNQNSGSTLQGIASAAGSWEKFDVVDAGSGLVALKAVVNGKYVMADMSNGGTLKATAAAIGSWEKFVWQDLGNNTFALKSNDNGRYVQNNTSVASGTLIAQASQINDNWQKFLWALSP